jgi:hypothetical protein
MINSLIKISLDTLLDFSVLAVVYTVTSVDDFSILLKMFTSCIVFLLAVARFYYFVKDMSTSKDEEKSKAK